MFSDKNDLKAKKGVHLCISFFIFGDNLILKTTIMGVTIHYRGKLTSPNLITALMDEVEEICISNNWQYQLLDDKSPPEEQAFPSPFEPNDFDSDLNFEPLAIGSELRGISFEPHEESERVTFLFDTEGVLRSIFSSIFKKKGKYTWCFVKTQFAGMETHIRIINLMAYLKKKYFKKLEIHDDGGYYPNNNTEELQNRMDYLNSAIATVHDVFENININNAKSPDEFIDDIKDALSASFKGANIQIIKIDPLSMMSDMLKSLGESTNEDAKSKKKRKKKKDTDEDIDLPF